MKIVVTRAAGFIGSAIYRYLLANTQAHVVIVDRLTYAATLDIARVSTNPRTTVEQVDICDAGQMDRVFSVHRRDAKAWVAAIRSCYAGERIGLYSALSP